jgi:hypothetical protein
LDLDRPIDGHALGISKELDIFGLLMCGFGFYSLLFGLDVDWIKYISTNVGQFNFGLGYSSISRFN